VELAGIDPATKRTITWFQIRPITW